MRFLAYALLLFCLPNSALALEDPTGGEPFFPWLWSKQLAPTATHSVELGGLGLLGAGAASTVVAHQYDWDVFNKEQVDPLMSNDTSGFFSTLGGGSLSVGIAALQLLLDQKNGLKTSRAILFTTVSHVTLAYLVRRPRPPGHEDYLPFASSFPSGHASNAFATAASLGYAYGWWVGVPATAVAVAIGAGRISENRHWLSDVVAGTTLGLFWARASNRVDQDQPVDEKAWQFLPTPFEDGLALNLSKRF